MLFILGLAKRLMDGLEVTSDKKRCYFVDLFVRVSNKLAIGIYEKLGYVIYRTVLDYYRQPIINHFSVDM